MIVDDIRIIGPAEWITCLQIKNFWQLYHMFSAKGQFCSCPPVGWASNKSVSELIFSFRGELQ